MKKWLKDNIIGVAAGVYLDNIYVRLEFWPIGMDLGLTLFSWKLGVEVLKDGLGRTHYIDLYAGPLYLDYSRHDREWVDEEDK